MTQVAVEAFFLRVGVGDRFCLFHTPGDAPVSAAVLYVHPFAEEMNKARRMAALQARSLARRGFAVLQLDLHGCGDSGGDFGDVTWRDWQEDVRAAIDWLHARLDRPLWLWGLRTGALLVAEVAAACGVASRLLFWQPVTSGRQHLTQFLRTKVAAAAIGGPNAGGGVRAMRERLAAGSAEEVAGYTVSSALAAGLDQAELMQPPVGSRVVWFEVAPNPGAGLSPVGSDWIERCRASGSSVDAIIVPGPPFWQTLEIAECSALVDETARILERAET